MSATVVVVESTVAVVIGANVVGGAAVVVIGATVVVGAAVVGTTVVVYARVAAGATVVAGVAVSELPPHPETTNKNASATAYFFIVSVCHPTPEGGVGGSLTPSV